MQVTAQLPLGHLPRRVPDHCSSRFDTLRLLTIELLSNCVQHSGRRGAITVEVTWQGGDPVRLAVAAGAACSGRGS